ncbi:MAG: hypothetical protein ACRC6M_12010, partial [Microcystaceae cyanobacterium]
IKSETASHFVTWGILQIGHGDRLVKLMIFKLGFIIVRKQREIRFGKIRFDSLSFDKRTVFINDK